MPLESHASRGGSAREMCTDQLGAYLLHPPDETPGRLPSRTARHAFRCDGPWRRPALFPGQGVGLARIELATSALSVLRSNRLSYSPSQAKCLFNDPILLTNPQGQPRPCAPNATSHRERASQSCRRRPIRYRIGLAYTSRRAWPSYDPSCSSGSANLPRWRRVELRSAFGDRGDQAEGTILSRPTFASAGSHTRRRQLLYRTGPPSLSGNSQASGSWLLSNTICSRKRSLTQGVIASLRGLAFRLPRFPGLERLSSLSLSPVQC